MNRDKELHALAAFVHGALTVLHILGLIYNIPRRNLRNRIGIVVHAGALAYSAWSAVHHVKETKE